MGKIGIYGGTFDPVHNGHLYRAKAAKEQLGLDEIWWIVSGNPPHKDDAVTGRRMRYDMCALALAENEDMALKDFEMSRSTECYSYELLEWLHEKFPQHKFYFIMGEDSLDLFPAWVHPERIAALASLVAAVRKESPDSADMEQTSEMIRSRFHTDVYLLQTENVPISSTNLRESVRQGKAIADFVPGAVEEYIRSHGLYQTRDYPDIQTIRSDLHHRLKPGRYRHTIGVMETAANLAMRYCMPVEKLRLAGLLHDCAKCYDNEELLKRCQKYGLAITEAEQRSPHLLHAKVGAYLAEHRYQVTDPDIVNAIRFHTTGNPAMTLTEQIIFIADYIEPNRDRARRLTEIRQLAYSDPDVCTLMILEDTIAYLKEKAQPMDQATVETYQYYKEKLGKTTFQ